MKDPVAAQSATTGPAKSDGSILEPALRLAYERTILAWVRTALSMIGFGFTIAKFFDYLGTRPDTPAPFLGAQAVGMTMIGIGLISTVFALVQIREVRSAYPGTPRSQAAILAAIVCVLGIAAMIGAVVRT